MIATQRVPRRDEIPAEYTWDLSTVYASESDWEAAIAQIEADVPRAVALQGRVGESAATLLEALRARDAISMQLEQVYVYANRRYDSDTGNPDGQALTERASSLAARVAAALAFISPEILAVPDEQIRGWLAAEPALQVYDYALRQLAEQRAHVRSAEVEGILAQFSDITRAPGEIAEILTNADLAFPTISDEQGQPVQLSHARYIRMVESQDRRVRREAFEGYHQAYSSIRNTLGMTLAAKVRANVVGSRLRGYSSALEAALLPNDIPVSVYHNLITTINANLPRLHRYVRLRRRLMGLDEIHFYDLYVPLEADADTPVSYDEARPLMLAALAPLGRDYVSALEETFSSRWIDVYENVNKRSGAYSDGSYTTAPFVLLNYQDKLRDAFVLAHELGHSTHSYFTRRNQPYVYGDYTIFVAEVASTLNEALLTDHLLRTSDDRALRRALVLQQIDDIRKTIFRQAMFAEFELDIHQATEQNEPLTAENLSQRYYELVGRYYGPDLVLGPQMAIEWARIPHLYYNFYVYQYATGLSAALALSGQIMREGQPAIDRYLRFLRSGSSKPSIELLREAGVDMTTPEPIQAAMDRFDALLDELESLS